jgi:ATP-dependent exoDNAse (exonuclease V) alpha subunit
LNKNFIILLDEQMFAPGQAYVAISRAKTWNSLNIIALDPNAIKLINK